MPRGKASDAESLGWEGEAGADEGLQTYCQVPAAGHDRGHVHLAARHLESKLIRRGGDLARAARMGLRLRIEKKERKERKERSVDFRELQVPTQPCPDNTAMCRFRAPRKEERITVGRVIMPGEDTP